MVMMAQDRSLSGLLRTIVEGITQVSDVVLARIWLIHAGDLCRTCPFNADCPDQTRCLHLVASAGNSNDAWADYQHTGGRFNRLPIGSLKIGRIAKSGEPLLISNIGGDEDWTADPDWIKREGVKTFVGHPLVHRGEILGVFAFFDSKDVGQVDFEWLNVFADYAALSIANTQAFEKSERARSRLEEENEYLRREVSADYGVGNLIGRSAVMQSVMQQVRLVAKTDATVLITGESGTGKELIAHAIHEQSPRRQRPLVKVNCGAITESLFESELFGHVRGAFTGAIKDKTGRFELADGGTLFLDEIGEVPLAMQSKLLRVLEERVFERVGEARSQKVDVRIVAATNRDLHAAAEAGRFRSDLLYRLNVFPLPLPPLRERGDDILQLAAHFAQQSANRFNYSVPELDEAAVRQFLAYPWPGNVRELRNVIERAVILSEGKSLDLQLPVLRQTDKDPHKTAVPIRLDRLGLMTSEELKQQERENMLAALRKTGGKVFGPSGAAALLGVRPTTLATRIKKMGLKRVWP